MYTCISLFFFFFINNNKNNLIVSLFFLWRQIFNKKILLNWLVFIKSWLNLWTEFIKGVWSRCWFQENYLVRNRYLTELKIYNLDCNYLKQTRKNRTHIFMTINSRNINNQINLSSIPIKITPSATKKEQTYFLIILFSFQ